MSYSDYSVSDHNRSETRPDKALVVKCAYDEAVRKITFSSTRTCSYELLRQRIEEGFSLYTTPFAITYTDDDGEVTDIATDADLTEAIRYVYPVNDDPPLSSSSSILSGRSLTRGKITLRVRITVEYDGPSLSDTSSLVSLEEYRNRNGSELSLSLSMPPAGEIEDDSITVSSKDMGSKHDMYRARGPKTMVSGPSRETLRNDAHEPTVEEEKWEGATMSSVPPTMAVDKLSSSHSYAPSSEQDPFSDKQAALDPTSVFERLRLEEDLQSRQPGSSYGSSTLHSERGAAWLRDQNARTIKGMLGELPAPSEKSYEPSVAAPEDTGSVLSGELALQQDATGKYYYAYTAGSSSYGASQSVPDSGFEDVSDVHRASITANPALSRPTSMEVNGYDYQEVSGNALHRSSSSASNPFIRRSMSEPIFPPDYIDPDVPPEVLQFITGIPPIPPENPPTCSNCRTIMDTFRYVCSTCGEQKPISPSELYGMDNGKGKTRAVEMEFTNGKYSFPPSPPTMSSASSTSSWSMVSSSNAPLRNTSDATLSAGPRSLKPLPAVPMNTGYELCWQCLPTAGVTHALEMSVAPGSSPSLAEWPSSEDAQRAMSQWRRTAPSQKGQLRHAYIEKSWGHKGWQDVEQDDHRSCTCSTCGTQIVNHRYKCASCENFNLCKACYSQVHEIHPSHAFLVVPDKLPRSRSEPHNMMSAYGEASLKHPGVKCFHCMQDIVGARFHCAICDAVDICSNCESAGLPGNLHESDGGHSSSHIMIKIPYPLGTAELQSASQMAKSLWSGRDAATGQRVRSRRNSLTSAYDRTVLGIGSRNNGNSSLDNASVAIEADDHGVRCDGCGGYVVGIRYQCASCPSLPKPYSLCAHCEERSYILHDPFHVFFKFPRPLNRPLQVGRPLVPKLYKYPAGPPDGNYAMSNPKGTCLHCDVLHSATTAYLAGLVHSFALCDRCMTRINGEWYRCGYCSIDLCEVCQRMDTHNDRHAFVVFKSPVRCFTSDVHNPTSIIPYPIYYS
ncbi:hypothetical protein POSPLADRAFT_1138078 [Postia placenta MAD-698-R-SB12]|uniref:ZZ-type domain-containing protein n=1 Tax=Postia placenta MAD-698-R-SB12 TaxID=670580 RepID=A0A1X6N731_9APHY|nr:hypothetical protein POSPLADRAFT_1138078 [Postia placenta MAD-698-R-SB12]OSX64438.1 hypothetical protein POSPLADRAFT_1138078 [Postia placenta MAD-698-R-SB12]